MTFSDVLGELSAALVLRTGALFRRLILWSTSEDVAREGCESFSNFCLGIVGRKEP